MTNPLRRYLDGLTDEALDNEIQRLSGIDPSNVYEGLVGRTVGETLQVLEDESRRRYGPYLW